MPTKKLEELYSGEKQQILHEQEMVEMVVDEPLPPGEPAGAPEKDPMTGEDSEYEDDSSRAYKEGLEESLRVYVGETVKDSERIPESTKPDFLKSIEETDLHGLMSLIMDGEIKSLDSDEAKVSLEQRFGETAWSEIQEAGVEGNLAAMVMLNPVIWAQWRALFALFSKAHRQCGVFTVSSERDACLKKARMQMSAKKMQILGKAKATCKKHKNPAKCVKVLDSGMAAEKEKIDKYKMQLQKLAMKGRVGPGSKPSKDTKLL